MHYGDVKAKGASLVGGVVYLNVLVVCSLLSGCFVSKLDANKDYRDDAGEVKTEMAPIAIDEYTMSIPNNRERRDVWRGIGISPQDEQTARSAALQDVASMLRSDVRSTFVERVSNEDQDVQYLLQVSSDLPILGPQLEVSRKSREFWAEARLYASISLPLYLNEMQACVQEIRAALNLLADEGLDASGRELLWRGILSKIEDYERYRTVALILGADAEQIPTLPASKPQALAALQRLQSSVDSLDRAVALLAASFEDDAIYVFPPRARGSTLPTAFANLLRERLKGSLRSTSNPSQAKAFLHGFYDYNDEFIEIVCHLRDPAGRTLKSRTLRMPIEFSGGFGYEALVTDFEHMLHTGQLVSNDLSISLRTAEGYENLLYSEGEELNVWVKVNKASRIYIVGYIHSGDTETAYLLPIQDGSKNDDAFVRNISADQANRWIDLGEFYVKPPFGIESLQAFAFTTEAVLRLPAYLFDQDTKLYLLRSDAPKESVVASVARTRALGRVQRKEDERAEATLSFVTHPRQEKSD